MNAAKRYPWIPAAILAGGAYFIIGRVSAGTREGRLTAWAMSALVYAVHIWYEHARLANRPLNAARHVAVGVAIGGFAIAVAGLLHAYSITAAIGPRWILALILFPALTALPGFIVAFGIATIARRIVIPRERSERGDLP
jgi:hypothetical protein